MLTQRDKRANAVVLPKPTRGDLMTRRNLRADLPNTLQRFFCILIYRLFQCFGDLVTIVTVLKRQLIFLKKLVQFLERPGTDETDLFQTMFLLKPRDSAGRGFAEKTCNEPL